MNRKNAMARLRTPNCWGCFKARTVTLLDHPYSAFTTQKTPTKWSARKLQNKATTKWCWPMWCGRWPLYCCLLLSLLWLLVSSPRDFRTGMKDWTAQQHHYSRLSKYGVQWNKKLWSSPITTWAWLFFSDELNHCKSRFKQAPGGGVLPYMGYIGTCRGIGYGFWGSRPLNRVSFFPFRYCIPGAVLW